MLSYAIFDICGNTINMTRFFREQPKWSWLKKRNLAIASKSRSASHSSPSGRIHNCWHMTADRCNWLRTLITCAVFWHTDNDRQFTVSEMTFKGHLRLSAMSSFISSGVCSMTVRAPDNGCRRGPITVGGTKFGQLTLTKIIKIVAIRWRILRLKCTKFDFGSLGELTALPQTP